MKYRTSKRITASVILIFMLAACNPFTRTISNEKWWRSYENNEYRIEYKTYVVIDDWKGYATSKRKHYRAFNKTNDYVCIKADIGYVYRIRHSFSDGWVKLEPLKRKNIGKTARHGSAIDDYKLELSWRMLPANKDNKCKWTLDELLNKS